MTVNDEDSKEVLRTIKFTLISISAGIIETLSFLILKEAFKLTEERYWIANLISLILSVLWNFTINRKYTFRSSANIPKTMALTFLFYVFFTPLAMFLTQEAVKAGANEYLMKFCQMLANLILEYLWTRLFVYRKTCDTLEDVEENESIFKE